MIRIACLVSFASALIASMAATAAPLSPLTWPEQKVIASNGQPHDAFGQAIAISGTTALIGAVDVNDWEGAIYVFTQSDGVWTEGQEFMADDGAPGDRATFSISDAIADEAGSDASASSNARGLVLDGAGTLVLDGEHTYSGVTEVDAGTLDVEGTLDASGVQVAGGSLGGIGTIAALVTTSGSVAPGAAAQPLGALHVAGDATLGAGATLSIKADAASGASASLVVDGAADVAGTIVLDFGGATPAEGTTFTVLSAGSISVQKASLVLPDGVSGQIAYSATSVTVAIGGGVPDAIFDDGFDGAAVAP